MGRVAGKSLADFSREAMFAPLDMKNALGNGGLLTTVVDLLRWNQNFTTAKVGGSSFVEQQLQRGKLTDGRTIFYAAGLMILHYKGLNEVSHSGTTAGYNAWLGRFPDQSLSVAVLCNTTAANGTQLGHAVADVFLGEATKPQATQTTVVDVSQAGAYRSTRDHTTFDVAAGPQQWSGRFEGGGRLRLISEEDQTVYEKVKRWNPASSDLEAFTGDYASDEAEVTLTVVIENDRLVARRRPDARIPLTPAYQDGFSIPGNASIRFLRDGSGKVTELSLGESRVWDLRFRKVR